MAVPPVLVFVFVFAFEFVVVTLLDLLFLFVFIFQHDQQKYSMSPFQHNLCYLCVCLCLCICPAFHQAQQKYILSFSAWSTLRWTWPAWQTGGEALTTWWAPTYSLILCCTFVGNNIYYSRSIYFGEQEHILWYTLVGISIDMISLHFWVSMIPVTKSVQKKFSKIRDQVLHNWWWWYKC